MKLYKTQKLNEVMEKIRLLLYCTKGTLLQWHFKKFLEKPYMTYGRKVKEEDYESPHTLNGKIVAECDFEVEEIKHTYLSSFHSQYCIRYSTNNLNEEELSRKSCLKQYSCNEDEETLCNYLGENNGYAIHIKNLNIFDKPRELNEYSKRIGNDFQVLGNAPQNMMKCCEIKYMVVDYILISIRPEYLVKILNKEKTIEVRKKILKEMVK